jgi:hypothetical protein
MHKTHHRRSRHRNRRTRRGGVKSAHTASASAAPAQPNPALQAILDRVKALAAQAQAQAQPMKPSRRSGISKSQNSEKRFKDILAGKVKHSHKSASKYGTHGRAGPGEQ